MGTGDDGSNGAAGSSNATGGASGNGCTRDTDCRAGRVCDAETRTCVFDDSTVCVPGSSTGCSCSNGRTGSQVCNDDGSAYGACVCTDPPTNGCGSDDDCAAGRICDNGICINNPNPGTGGTEGTGGSSTGTGGSGNPGVCVPGAADACNCDNGQNGARICGTNGTFGPCVCSGGNTSGWVSVTLTYVLHVDISVDQVVIAGWATGMTEYGDLCNSQAPAGDPHLLTQVGARTFSCTRLLPPSWRDGNYNARISRPDGSTVFPSHSGTQNFCYEVLGNDRGTCTAANCYAFYGQLFVGGIDLSSAACWHSNGLTEGCNVTPSQCS